jgi:hypothetical protein
LRNEISETYRARKWDEAFIASIGLEDAYKIRVHASHYGVRRSQLSISGGVVEGQILDGLKEPVIHRVLRKKFAWLCDPIV